MSKNLCIKPLWTRYFKRVTVVCEQVLRGALAAGREKEGELASTSLEFEFHLQFPCGSRSTELSEIPPISAKRKRGRMETNTEKHVPRVITSLLSSPPFSVSHRLFRCRYSNSREVVASSPSFSRPAVRAPRRACSQARVTLDRVIRVDSYSGNW